MSAPVIILVILIGGFFVWQLRSLIAARKMYGKTIPNLPETLNQSSSSKQLYYFWSEHCGMCKNMTPILKSLAQERSNVILINIADQPELAQQLNIKAIPSLVLMNNNTISKILIGAKPKKTILSLLNDQ